MAASVRTAADTRAIFAARCGNRAVVYGYVRAISVAAAADSCCAAAACRDNCAVLNFEIIAISFVAAADTRSVFAACRVNRAAVYATIAASVVAAADSRAVFAACRINYSAVNFYMHSRMLIAAADSRSVFAALCNKLACAVLLCFYFETTSPFVFLQPRAAVFCGFQSVCRAVRKRDFNYFIVIFSNFKRRARVSFDIHARKRYVRGSALINHNSVGCRGALVCVCNRYRFV